MSSKTTYNFIINTGKPVSIQDKELQRSVARSHAARVSHKNSPRRWASLSVKTHKTGSDKFVHNVAGLSSSFSHCEAQGVPLRRESKTLFLEDDQECENSEAVSIGRDRCGYRIDPFSNYFDHEDTWNAIDYLGSAVASNQAIIDEIFNVHSVTSNCGLTLIANDDLRCCLLAQILANRHKHEHPHEPTPPHILKYVQDGLVSHRSRLRKGHVDHFTIVATMFLAVTSLALGDKEAYEVHRRNIEPLLSLLGGLESPVLGIATQSCIIQLESALSLGLGMRSVFCDVSPIYVAYYPSHPFSTEVMLMINKLPAGFQPLVKQRKIAMDVLEVLLRVSELIPVVEIDGKITFQISTRRFLGFWQACPCLARPDGIDGQPDIEKLIVMGLILFCYNTSCRRPDLTLLYGTVRKRMADYMARSLALDEEKRVIQWIWMVTIDSWRMPTPLATRSRLVLLRQMKSSSFAFTSIEEMHDSLTQFFWNAKFMNRCETYWRDLATD